MDDQTPTVLQTTACAIAAGSGASFSSLDRLVPVRTMLWHVCLALIMGAMGLHFSKAMWPNVPWYGTVLPLFVLGFCIYGIAVALRRSDKTIGAIDPAAIVKNRTGVDVTTTTTTEVVVKKDDGEKKS